MSSLDSQHCPIASLRPSVGKIEEQSRCDGERDWQIYEERGHGGDG
jgi:hypothetical protein